MIREPVKPESVNSYSKPREMAGLVNYIDFNVVC